MLGWGVVDVARVVEAARRRLRGTERARTVSEAVLTFVAGAVFVAVDFVDVLGGTGSAGTALGPWEHLVTLAAGCAALLAKRRRPALVLVACVALAAADLAVGGSLGMILVLFDAVYTAALHGSARLLVVLQVAAAAVVAGTVVAVAVVSRDLRVAFFAGLQVFAIVVSALWWGMSVRHHAQARRLAEARAEDLRRLAALREQEVRTEERTRMARDLHDAVAGELSAIALHAEAALARPVDDGAPARDRAALEAVRAASVQSLAEMRSMIRLLRSGTDAVAAPSRLRDLPALAERTRAAGHAVELRPSEPEALPPLGSAVDQACYRIVQESLTNAVKHAPGGRSTVEVAVCGGEVRVAVTTTPGGVPRAPSAVSSAPGGAGTGGAGGAGAGSAEGLGLLTMRERAESLGGWFEAGPRDDGAWSVRAGVPVEVGS